MGEACDGPSINMTFSLPAPHGGRYAFIATATNAMRFVIEDTLDVEVVAYS